MQFFYIIGITLLAFSATLINLRDPFPVEDVELLRAEAIAYNLVVYNQAAERFMDENPDHVGVIAEDNLPLPGGFRNMGNWSSRVFADGTLLTIALNNNSFPDAVPGPQIARIAQELTDGSLSYAWTRNNTAVSPYVLDPANGNNVYERAIPLAVADNLPLSMKFIGEAPNNGELCEKAGLDPADCVPSVSNPPEISNIPGVSSPITTPNPDIQTDIPVSIIDEEACTDPAFCVTLATTETFRIGDTINSAQSFDFDGDDVRFTSPDIGTENPDGVSVNVFNNGVLEFIVPLSLNPLTPDFTGGLRQWVATVEDPFGTGSQDDDIAQASFVIHEREDTRTVTTFDPDHPVLTTGDFNTANTVIIGSSSSQDINPIRDSQITITMTSQPQGLATCILNAAASCDPSFDPYLITMTATRLTPAGACSGGCDEVTGPFSVSGPSGKTFNFSAFGQDFSIALADDGAEAVVTDPVNSTHTQFGADINTTETFTVIIDSPANIASLPIPEAELFSYTFLLPHPDITFIDEDGVEATRQPRFIFDETTNGMTLNGAPVLQSTFIYEGVTYVFNRNALSLTQITDGGDTVIGTQTVWSHNGNEFIDNGTSITVNGNIFNNGDIINGFRYNINNNILNAEAI